MLKVAKMAQKREKHTRIFIKVRQNDLGFRKIQIELKSAILQSS